MKYYKNKVIIGIDHGYGNIKTANHVFRTGVLKHDAEPLFTKNLLVYDGRYYTIGEGHKEFTPEKQIDEDYYVLTLAAIAMELHSVGKTDADVFIAAGLPLTWTNGQKSEFSAYLTKNSEVTFTFQRVRYRIRILGANIYPQGYAAIRLSARFPVRAGNPTSACGGSLRLCLRRGPNGYVFFLLTNIHYIANQLIL
ncbi:MAG: ParM/StbA family protein [Bacteroidales bacterium]|nr:ParM/StbA family protein [Bacteroidales bacterium]